MSPPSPTTNFITMEYYPLFTYTGIGFCVLIGLSWAISLFDKTGEV